MGNYLHKDISISEGIHLPYSFEYADQSTREGASGLLVTDVGKFARQLNNNSIWMLTNYDPVTWMQINASGSAAVFGTEYFCAVSEGDSSTTSTTYVNKLTLNTPSIPAGEYLINFYTEISNEIKDILISSRAQLDSVDFAEMETAVPTNFIYTSFSGIHRVIFGSASTHEITIDYKTESGTVHIRRTRLIIWRVA